MDGILDSAFVQENCQGDFVKDGYCIIPNAISKELCGFISKYALLKYDVSPNIYNNADDSLAKIHREYGQIWCRSKMHLISSDTTLYKGGGCQTS